MACTGLRRRRMSASAHPARQPYIRGARGRTRDLARPYRTYAFRATVERGDIPCRGLRRRGTPAHPMACTALRRRRMPASAYPVRDPYIRGPRGRTCDRARPYRACPFRATLQRGDLPCRGLRRRRTPAHPMACTALRRRRMPASAYPVRQPYVCGPRGRTRDLARPYRTYAFRATVERGDIPCRGLRRRRTPAHPMACTALRRRRMPASAYPVRDPYIRGPRGRTRDLELRCAPGSSPATWARGDTPCTGI